MLKPPCISATMYHFQKDLAVPTVLASASPAVGAFAFEPHCEAATPGHCISANLCRQRTAAMRAPSDEGGHQQLGTLIDGMILEAN